MPRGGRWEMKVEELRKILDALPGDMTILTYDHGYLGDEFCGAVVHQCAPLPGEKLLRIIEERSGHPEGAKGANYLVIF